jgi:hypothetical protein
MQILPDPIGRTAETRIFTIGHSNHSLTHLIDLLQAVGVTAIADVRSHPFSQRHPQFNRPELELGLKACSITYVFLGDHLGGRPAQLSLYDDNGRVDYERVRATARFRQGLDRVCQALQRFTVALLCAEEDPLDCHRGLMIAPALQERKLAPGHLRADGSVESTAELEARLLSRTKVGEEISDGLFAAFLTADEQRDLLAEAYRFQARRKAYRLRPGQSSEPLPDPAGEEDCE